MLKLLPGLTRSVAALLILFGASNVVTAKDKTLRDQLMDKVEAAIENTRASCAGDIAKYCTTVTPGDGRIALCLEAHEDKISSKCFWSILEFAQGILGAESNLEYAASICKSDIDKHCASVVPGEGRIAQCIAENESKLTPDCATELASFKNRVAK
jgi:hypothetical protein